MPRLVLCFAILLLSSSNCCLRSQTTNASTSTEKASQTLPVRQVTFEIDGDSRTVVGEVVTEAVDGGIMLRSDAGRMWVIQPDQLLSSQDLDGPLQPIDQETIGKRLIEELGDSFHVHRTNHYVVLYNSDENHARRVAALFESLYRVFNNYWKKQKFDVQESRFPLVAIVLRDHRMFLDHATKEIGPSAENMIGYYSLTTNQMTSFNVPNWERNVATIIHEATHQLAYNCGLQKRFADNPMWVSEGLAMFFESPDMRSPGKWRGVGRVNRVNLARWKKLQYHRPQESLMTLLSDDKRFRQSSTATEAYAESWALTYFLIRTRKKQYLQYMQMLSEGKPLEERSGRERVTMFAEVFGEDLVKFDKAFVKYMRRVK